MKKKYDKSNLASFSVNDSSMEIIEDGLNRKIRKIIRLNESIKKEVSLVFKYTLNYIEQLKDAGIDLPKIYENYHTDEEIIFVCEYMGENITDYVQPNRFETTLKDENIFQYMFDCLKKAQNADINFDPHPKNYVLQDGIITYVDFTPPWHQNYYDLRISNSSNESEEKVMKEFFLCFHPNEIGYHFAGDLLKMHDNIYPMLPLLYKELSSRNIISSSYKDFISKAEMIKKRELAREENNIYLL
tara:strand:+ start:368 stop:1099 length:732 start_codon:yes stop_codon:yes gene_type:complete